MLLTNRKIFRLLGIFLLTFFLLAFLGLGAAAGYASAYRGRVYPGVHVAGYELGGSAAADVVKFIESINNRLAKEGLNFTAAAGDKNIQFKINTVTGGDSSVEVVALDGESLVKNALAVGRQGNFLNKLWQPLWLRLAPVALPAPVQIDDNILRQILRSNLEKLSDEPRSANILAHNYPNLQIEMISERAGQDFVYDDIVALIKKDLGALRFNTWNLTPVYFAPAIKAAELTNLEDKVRPLLDYGSITLNNIDPQTKYQRQWVIGADQLGEWLRVKRDNNNDLVFSLDEEKVKTYLDNLRYLVEYPTRDAKFVVDNGKVKEFQASRIGLKLDIDKTFQNLAQVFEDRNYHPQTPGRAVSLTVDLVEPNVKMADANNLGIEAIIGTGVSTFKDSHNNRIKNIANAVKRLNGTLIKPDEEFSAIKYAGPFTAENGFLPEAVIKGDQITDEIGGGMCQIGTTLFRMAMNSGMDITQRRNHSLVVGYYADPVNGNPGTDATLYEPSLDLKFKNDTGNYLLLQTDIDYDKQQLTFTLWGKPDGRSGSYTHPLVSKWIPAGDTQTVVSPTLAPGVTKCQSAFSGAEASFTYSRVTPDGKKIDRVFESFYRPLPKICLVGATTTPANLDNGATVPTAAPVIGEPGE